MALLAKLKSAAANLKREIAVLTLAVQHPRTPWYAKVFVACVVAYALSPIDLIPDFVPILGYMDDLLLIPLGTFLALRMIPQQVVLECRLKAIREQQARRRSWTAAIVIVILWIVALAWGAVWVRQAFFG